jgi:hypothetical protein
MTAAPKQTDFVEAGQTQRVLYRRRSFTLRRIQRNVSAEPPRQVVSVLPLIIIRQKTIALFC